MKDTFKRIIQAAAAGIFIFSSCQKEIEVTLPEAQKKICVDGKIEQGLPPFVVLTRNQAYFGSTDLSALQNMFIHDAVVRVFDGTTSVQLKEVCTSSLPDSLLPFVSAATGISIQSLMGFSYCIYTSLDPPFFLGQVGKTYTLTVEAEGRSLHSVTEILPPVPLDKTWAKYYKTDTKGDSLGFVHAHLTDPAAMGDNYRWFAKRLGKDASFVPPISSVFDDKYINGQSFDFAYDRGRTPGEEETNEHVGWFAKGDTVVIKFCKIDRGSYEFINKMEIAIYSQGNPFAAPASVPSNVLPREDALGIWCGYSYSKLDTVIFK